MTVLIVENLPLLRRLFVETLTAEGEPVLSAASYEEALDLAEHGVSRVITDINLGGRSGLELLKELRARRPELPVACMSADRSLLVEAGRAGADALLQKPFDLDDLRLIARLLRLEAEIPARFRP